MNPNNMLDYLRSKISPQNKLLLLYHRVLAMCSALMCGLPARKIKVIAVTGTSGKTTTVTLISKIFERAGKKVGVACGTHFKINKKEWVNDTKKTTVSRLSLQKLIARMVAEGCEYFIF